MGKWLKYEWVLITACKWVIRCIFWILIESLKWISVLCFNGFFCYGSSSVCFLPACQLAGRGRASAASQLGHHGGQASAPRQSQLCGICLLLHFELFVEESGRFLNMDPQNQFHCCKECYVNKNVVMFTMASWYGFVEAAGCAWLKCEASGWGRYQCHVQLEW